MNDLYFTAKNKKACKDVNNPDKACKFNEILLCRMKSKQVWMKSSAKASDEIKSASPNPALAGFHREAISSTKVDLFRRRRISQKKGVQM